MATSTSKNGQWHASYWDNAKHGSAWERVKEAMKRDWTQTKADVHASTGKELRQNVDDTVKQAVGSKPIPPPNKANPPDFNDKKMVDFDEVEPAVAYGFGAREEYGNKFKSWDEKLETRLADEWNKDETGKDFNEVKPYIRRGWDYQKTR